MNKHILFLYFLISFISPVAAQTSNDDHRYILDVVQSLKEIVHKQKNEKAAKTALNRIKDSKSLVNNDRYLGQQLIQDGKLIGLIGIEYNKTKASVAVFSTPSLKIRYATRRYKVFRSLLQERYNELSHNHFDLGNQIIARIKKQARKVTIDVYRKN